MRSYARPVRVAVVGGGIAGLAAALEVRRLQPAADLLLIEAAARLGGKIAVSEVGGLAVDEGADSMLTRVPEGLALLRAAGLDGESVSPAVASASIWTRGRLRPLPGGTILGIPTDLAALARSEVLTSAGLARVPLDLVLPGAGVADDVSVGTLVRRRFGGEVVERLVDPLLGGVYAGRADALSLQATLPQLVEPLRLSRSLLLATRAARATTPPPDGPLFASLAGGLGRLPAALARASGAQIRLGTTVRQVRRTPTGWSLLAGSPARPRQLSADAVVLAVPGSAASRLLGDLVPTAARELGELDYASVAIITLVLGAPLPGSGSGYLVPAVDGHATKAVTFSSRKWAHLAGDHAVVRTSVGRSGDAHVLQREDADLVRIVCDELSQAVGPLPPLVDSRVTRWGGGLPQYAVGHLDRVRRLRSALPAGLAVAGAAYDGVGVPACARSGRDAARAALAGAVAQNGSYERDEHRPARGDQGT